MVHTDAIGGLQPKPRRFIEPTVCVHSGPPCCCPLPQIGSTSFGRQLTLPADFFVSFNFGDQVLA